MLKRVISFILVFSMLLSILVSPTPIFTISADENTPIITVLNKIDWEGVEAKAGDTEFYVEAKGKNLKNLTAVACTLKANTSDEFEPITVQLDHKYMGIDSLGDEWHIYKLKTDAKGLVIDTTYYVFLQDKDGNNYKDKNSNNYFDIYSTEIDPYIENMTNRDQVEIPDSLASYKVLADGFYFPTDVKPSDIKLGLYKGSLGHNKHGNQGAQDAVMVGEADSVEIYEAGSNHILISGNVMFNNESKIGEGLYIGITYKNQTYYSYSPIAFAIDSSKLTLGQFSVKNGIQKFDSYSQGMRDNYAAANESAYYISSELSSIDFKLTGVNIEDSSKLNVKDSALSNVNASSDKFGITTITGSLAVSQATSSSAITFTYDGQDIYTLPIERSSLTGCVSNEHDLTLKNGFPQWPSDNEFEITLSTFGNYDGDFTGVLLKSNGNDKVADLDVTKSRKANGDILLTVKLHNNIEDNAYVINIFCNNEGLNSLYYNTITNELSKSDKSPIYVYITKNSNIPSTVLESIMQNKGDLELIGGKFAKNANYKANFIKRGLNSGLSTTPQIVEVAYASETKLTISKEAIKALPLGWYTVYLTDGASQVSGFADIAIIPYDDSEKIIAPTVTINKGASTTGSREVTLDFTAGSYNQVRFAESEELLKTAEYQAIAPSIKYTLSEGYGKKTIYFEFKTVNGLVFKASASITYQEQNIDDMLSYGIAGMKYTDTSLELDKTASYNFYITSKTSGLNGNVVFLDENKNEIGREELKCTAIKEGIYTYSKWVSVLKYTATKNIVFYLSDIADVNRVSKSEEIKAEILEIAQISSVKTEFKHNFINSNQYIISNSEAKYSLSGTPDCTAKAILTYKNTANETKTKDIVLKHEQYDLTKYTCKDTIPTDATEVISVEYKLTSSSNKETSKAETVNIKIAGKLRLSNLKNEDGKYNNKKVVLTDANGKHYSASIIDNNTAIEFDALQAGTYTYEIKDYNITYISGTATVADGVINNIDVSSSKVPLTVKFIVNGAELKSNARICYSYTLDGNEYQYYARINEPLSGFYNDLKINYTLYLGSEDLKLYAMPETQTIVINEDTKEVSINLTPLKKVTLSGKVKDSMVAGRNIEGVNLSFSQYILNGTQYFSYSTNAVTDKNGNYSVEIYATSIDVTCTKDGYEKKYVDLDVTDDKVQDIELDYNDKNIIRIMLYGSENMLKGEAAPENIALDSSILGYCTVKKSDGQYVDTYVKYGTTNLCIYDNSVKAGDKLIITPVLNDNKVTKQKSYEVTLDEYKSASIEVIATNCGTFEAKVVDNSNTSTYYMLIFDKDNDRLMGIDTGDSRLTNENCNLKNVKNCVAIFIKGNELKNLVPLIDTLENFYNLGLIENEEYIKHEIELENGIHQNIGDITLNKEVNCDMLHFKAQYSKNFYINKRQAVLIADFSSVLSIYDNEIDIKQVDLIIPDGAEIDYVRYNYAGYGKTSSIVLDNSVNDTRGNIYATINVADDEITKIGIKITYTINGKENTRTFTTTVDTPYATINPPIEVKRGMDAQNIVINGICKKSTDIEIYDDETLVGKTKSDYRGNYSLTVALTNPDECCLHYLRAKAVIGDKEYYSNYSLTNIIDPKTAAYVSNFSFRNINPVYDPLSKQKFEVAGPSNSNNTIVSAYYPAVESEVSFRINNLLQKDLNEVDVINTYNGVENTFVAEWVKDVQNENECYSEWYYKGHFGYLGELSVFYDLKSLDELFKITGDIELDFEKVANAAVDPAKLPISVRENIDTLKITENTNDKITGSMDLPGGNTNFNITYKENITDVSTEALIKDGYKAYKTKQGTYYVKETCQDSTTGNIVNAKLSRTMYFDSSLTDILNGKNIQAKNNDIVIENKVFAYSNDCIITTSNIKLAQLKSAVDTSLSMVNMEGTIQTTTEVIYEATKGKALDLGKFGTGMQVVGGLALAIDIFRGVQTKGTEPLYQAAGLIKDDAKREQVYNEIMTYGTVSKNTHYKKLLFGSISYGTTFGGPTAKVVGIVAGVGGGYFISAAEAEHNKEWDAIMRGILAIIEVEEYREKKKDEKEKKDKKKYGKKSKIIDPKWSIDPSGYVYEAIDSQRIADITAKAYYKDDFDNFVYWDDADLYDETNPDTTDIEGRYGWNVPEGEWMVKFNGEGYQDSETKSMSVPPVHDAVNIGLMSTKAPSVKTAVINENGAEIELDMFMQAETIFDKNNNINSIRIFDSANREVPCKDIEFIISAENKTYKADQLYQNDIIDSNTFIKRIRFKVDEDNYIGGFHKYMDDGETPEKYKVVISSNAQSYAGVNMNTEYKSNDIELTEKAKLDAPSASIASGEYTQTQEVILSAAEGATIYYTIDGTEPNCLSNVYSTKLYIMESTKLKFMTSKAGCEDSDIMTCDYSIVEAPKQPKGPDKPNDPIPPTIPPTPANRYQESSNNSQNTTTTTPSTQPDNKKVREYKGEFNDINDNDWFYNSVIFAYERGLFSGITESDFMPYESMTRAMLVTVLHRYADKPNADEYGFADIKDNAWYTDAVNWAAVNQIVNGVGNNSFDPDRSITREQIAVILYNFAKYLDTDIDVNGEELVFNDKADISAWAEQAIKWAVEKGIITGKDNNKLDPNKTATRAEVAMMLFRFITLIEK